MSPHTSPQSTASALLEPPVQSAEWQDLGNGVSLRQTALTPRAVALFPADAVALLAELHRELQGERLRLLEAREEVQRCWDSGEVPHYLDRNSEAVRGDWKVAPIPADLRRRRVEITGPVNDRKMVLYMLSRNAQGQRADTAMLDFEDSMKPTWTNVVDGLHNVRGVADGTLTHLRQGKGQASRLLKLDTDDQAHPMVRVRGLHLEESNLRVDGEPISAGLFDLALCFFHTARTFVRWGRTPTYYVPKCEHHLEARWWSRLFTRLEEHCGLPMGTLRATFLIETLPAAFQVEEILYEIRRHAAGLNVGRWDKIFSDIKVLKSHPDRVMADRATIGMERAWMASYAKRLVAICHRRGAYAIGGMAAFTPGRDPQERQRQTARVLEDKRREADLGHDGCWVSHPYFIGPALEAFSQDHQLGVIHPDYDKYPDDLLPQGTAPRTEAGLRTNLRVGIAYLAGWSQGLGCIAWDGLMEDLATLEISRSQTWQWLHHGVALDDGRKVTRELVEALLAQELANILVQVGAETGDEKRREDRRESLRRAAVQVGELFTAETLAPFLATASEPA